MPIIQSAKKQLRQNKKRKARNDFFRATYREARKAFEEAIKNKDLKTAKEIFENKKDKDGKTKKITNLPDFLKYRGKDEGLAYPRAKKIKQKGGKNEK